MPASFEEILNKPASEIKSPPAYPVGTYHCLVNGPLEHVKSSQKQTDGYRIKFKILSPREDVDQKTYTEQALSGQDIIEDYWITEKSAWRLKELLTDHLGIDETNKKFLELLAEAPGKQVYVKLKHEVTQDGKRTRHVVESTARV